MEIGTAATPGIYNIHIPPQIKVLLETDEKEIRHLRGSTSTLYFSIDVFLLRLPS